MAGELAALPCVCGHTRSSSVDREGTAVPTAGPRIFRVQPLPVGVPTEVTTGWTHVRLPPAQHLEGCRASLPRPMVSPFSSSRDGELILLRLLVPGDPQLPPISPGSAQSDPFTPGMVLQNLLLVLSSPPPPCFLAPPCTVHFLSLVSTSSVLALTWIHHHR